MMDIFTIKQWLFLLIASIWMLIFFDVLIALLLGCIFLPAKKREQRNPETGQRRPGETHSKAGLTC